MALGTRGASAVVFTLILWACLPVVESPAPDRSARSEAPDRRAPPTPQTTVLIVIDETDLPYRSGDSIRVALDRVSDYGLQVAAYDSLDNFDRWVPILNLGLADRGTMAVNATSLNVRDCPATRCSVVGQIRAGDRVNVTEFVDGWFRISAGGDGENRFVSARYLALPIAYQRKLVREVQLETESFARELQRVRMPGFGTVFTDHEVRLQGGILRFKFYSPHAQGPPLLAVCEGMELIANFVERTMRSIPSDWINAYSAGVFWGVDWNYTDMELAGLGDRGAIYCRRPY